MRVDLSADALALARENAERLGACRAHPILPGSICSTTVEGAFDLIVANLPYVAANEAAQLAPEVRHDPAVALFGGAVGDELIRELIAAAPPHMRPRRTARARDWSSISRNALLADFLAAEELPRHSSRKRIMQEPHVSSSPGMDKILVHGGHPLSGSIKISGSKNSALPIIAATLLTREPCVMHRVPDLSDTNYMLQILMHLGAEVERASGTVTVKAEKVDSVAPYEIVRKMRASVCVLGPLLGRCKEATVSLPGGCVIGDRPIDLHLKGFEALGAAVRVESGNVKVFAPKLTGAVINLRGKFGPTVLGTDNVMMAAVLAEGVTVIEARPPNPKCAIWPISSTRWARKSRAQARAASSSKA